MIRFLQGKPLHVRKRIAIIATGIIGIILVLIMLYVYAHPPKTTHDPAKGIIAISTMFFEKVQSLFHRK